MATIDDLPMQSLTNMSQDEAFELLRQIRLSRRTSKKKVSTTRKAKPKALAPSEMSPEQAAKLLKLLGGA
jgi:hypothetical protein